MDALIKQVRAFVREKLLNVGQENNTSSPNRRTQLLKTQSFKGEKKKDQNWLQRQFSRQLSRDYDPNIQIEHAAAVAATAYAIKSMEESGSPDQKKKSEGLFPFLTKLRSKKEDAPIPVQEITNESPQLQPSFTRLSSKKEDTPGSGSRHFSAGEIAMMNSGGLVEEIDAIEEKSPEKPIRSPKKKTLSFGDNVSNSSDITQFKGTPSKGTDLPPSMKRTPTFDNGEAREIPIEPVAPPSFKPTIASAEIKRQSSVKPGADETEADAWEKSEMDKIKERYEKLERTIHSWEEKKKKKARSKLDRVERHMAETRLKALTKFNGEMESIHRMAGGARAQAGKRRRNEEMKAKEKANIIKTTGKTPASRCRFLFRFWTHQ